MEAKGHIENLKPVTERAREIPPFIVMDVLERAQELEREGRHIVHLEVGEPDFETPACICEAGLAAMRAGHTHYTHSLGLFELREAICRHYHEKYGVRIQPDQVVVTSGTSPALFMLFSGGLMFGAVFMVTDPVTTPLTSRGAWIFGIGVGLLVVLIRLFGGLPEGVMYAILLMNSVTPLINRYTQPRRFGG